MLLNAQAEREGRLLKQGALASAAAFLLAIGAPPGIPAFAAAFLLFDIGWHVHVGWAQRQGTVSTTRYRLLLAHSILNSSVFAAFIIYISRLDWPYAPMTAAMLLIAQAMQHIAFESNGRDEMLWSIFLLTGVAQVIVFPFHPVDPLPTDLLFLHGGTGLLSVFAAFAAWRAYRLKAALRSTRADLVTSERVSAAGLLASRLAHEFRDLLTVMRGNVDLIPVVEPEERPTLLSEIRRATERGERLVSRLTLIETDRPEAVREVELGAQLGRFVRFAERVLPRGISLRMTEAPSDMRMPLDVAQFEAALLEVVLDARDAMPEGGVIAFDVTTGTDTPDGRVGVTITVSDTGQGRPPKGPAPDRPALRDFVAATGGRLDIRRSEAGGISVAVTLPA